MNVAANTCVASVATAATPAQRRTVLTAGALVVLTFACLWPTTVSLMVRWEDTVHRTYTHGYAIVVLSLWLMWRDRSRLESTRPCIPALIALGGAAIVWLIAWRAGLQIVHQALLPAMALLAVLSSCGWPVSRRLLLPVLYLYCAIPVWDAINPVLQSISVFAVRALLRLFDIPAFFDGIRFELPAGAFEIADGCSGLHFFVVAFSVAVLYGAVNRDTLRTRVMLIAFGLALAMMTNWIRIFIIVLAGHLTDMQHYLIVDEHYSFGWLVFAGSMVVFFLVVRRWPLAQIAATNRVPEASSPVAVPAALAALSGLMLGPLVSVVDRNKGASAAVHEFSSPEGGWVSDAAEQGWRPVFVGADSEQLRRYRRGVATVDAYSATYLWQQQGKEIAGYGNSVLGELSAASGSVSTAPWRRLHAQDRQGQDWVVRYAQRIDSDWIESGLGAQLTYGLRSLFAAPVSSIIVLRGRCAPDCDAAEASLDEFILAAALK